MTEITLSIKEIETCLEMERTSIINRVRFNKEKFIELLISKGFKPLHCDRKVLAGCITWFKSDVDKNYHFTQVI